MTKRVKLDTETPVKTRDSRRALLGRRPRISPIEDRARNVVVARYNPATTNYDMTLRDRRRPRRGERRTILTCRQALKRAAELVGEAVEPSGSRPSAAR